MPRKFIKRVMPDHQKIRDQKCLRFLGNCLHNPSLWNLNRHSVAGAFFIGMFCAFLPIPFQMVVAAVLAVLLQVNIPVAVVLVWLTNPITMPPLFYFSYEVGAWVLGQPDSGNFAFEPSLEWMLNLLQHNWQPFILGCLITGITVGLLGFIAIHLVWRSHVSHRWRTRPWRLAKGMLRSRFVSSNKGRGDNSKPAASAKSSATASGAAKSAPTAAVSARRSDSVRL